MYTPATPSLKAALRSSTACAATVVIPKTKKSTDWFHNGVADDASVDDSSVVGTG
jgi:hypothetical protein